MKPRALLVAAIAASSLAALPARADSAVAIKSLSYDPASVTVDAGETVTWSNQDPVAHSVVADGGGFDSGDVAAGSSWRHRFDTAGTYAYHCRIHDVMHGTVVVRAASSPISVPVGGGAPKSPQPTAATSPVPVRKSTTRAPASTPTPAPAVSSTPEVSPTDVYKPWTPYTPLPIIDASPVAEATSTELAAPPDLSPPRSHKSASSLMLLFVVLGFFGIVRGWKKRA